MTARSSNTTKVEDESQKESTSNKKDQSQEQKQKQSKSETDFLREELERMKKNATKYNSSLNPPEREPFVPYIFNSLQPYTDMRSLETAINEPTELQHFPVSRNTALGICEPWISLDMDVVIPSSIPSTARDSSKNSECKANKGQTTNRSTKKDGEQDDPEMTQVEQYPIVTPRPSQFHGKSLHFGQVPMLREELKRTYSAEAQRRIDEDYERTKQYFYGYQLDKMDEYRPSSRHKMRATYFAYLQNNPGSKKAVYECMRNSANEGEGKKADSEKADTKKMNKKNKDAEKEKNDKSTSSESKCGQKNSHNETKDSCKDVSSKNQKQQQPTKKQDVNNKKNEKTDDTKNYHKDQNKQNQAK